MTLAYLWNGTDVDADFGDLKGKKVAVVGSGYQRLFVIPSLDLVIVRQGTNAKFSDAEFLRKLLRH